MSVNTTGVKYPEAIFGVFSDMITNKLKLGHGFEHSPTAVEKFVELANEDYVIARRETLEKRLGIHQILPYLLILEDQNGDDIPENDLFKVHNYQRVKGDGSGEVRLLDAHSIGPGGHADGNEVLAHRQFVEGSIVDIWEVIIDCAMRELGQECKFEYGGETYSPFPGEFKALGIVLDNQPASTEQVRKGEIPVGSVHVGIVLALVVRKGTKVVGGETKMKFFEPQTPQELLASGRKWEPWSQLILEKIQNHDLGTIWLQSVNKG